MNIELRNKRLRALVKRVNRERKKQAKKVDMICNDLITGQRDFIEKLNVFSFSAYFYKMILGITELNKLLSVADRMVKEQIEEASVAFFIRTNDSYEMHILEHDKPITMDKRRLENYFTKEVVKNVCAANKMCELDSLLETGLQLPPQLFSKVAAVTVPLTEGGGAIGFILIYRSTEKPITTNELKNICAISGGLSKAIGCCTTAKSAVDF